MARTHTNKWGGGRIPTQVTIFGVKTIKIEIFILYKKNVINIEITFLLHRKNVKIVNHV